MPAGSEKCFNQYRPFAEEPENVPQKSCLPYYCYPQGYKAPAPIKKSMSFLSSSELFSYKAIPAAAVTAYLATSVGTIANQETFVRWFGSEYTAVTLVNSFTAASMCGIACYVYGRRHIRHAGAFQKVIYPLYTSVFFNMASHFSWAFIKGVLCDQQCFDYHWRVIMGLLSGGLFLYIETKLMRLLMRKEKIIVEHAVDIRLSLVLGESGQYHLIMYPCDEPVKAAPCEKKLLPAPSPICSISQTMSPYPCATYKYPPAKKSISFLTSQELISYRALPILGCCAYLSTAVGTTAIDETFVKWFGSEYSAINMLNGLTFTSWLGIGCYIYGRRHIRHAGAFQKVIYPVFSSTAFVTASHFSWAFIKDLLRDQRVFDYKWRCLSGVASGLLFLYIGKSYLLFVDHW